MTADVVVAVAGLEDVVRLAGVQRTFRDAPVHVWWPGRRSLLVRPADKEALHAVLRARERRFGSAPLLRPADGLLHEARRLDEIVARLLRPDAGRRVFARRGGTFQGRRLEVADPAATVPFRGVWFLVARGCALEGRGTFEDLVSRGRLVARYPPTLAQAASRPAGGRGAAFPAPRARRRAATAPLRAPAGGRPAPEALTVGKRES